MRTLSHNFSFVGRFPTKKYSDLRLTTPKEAAKVEGREVWCHKVVLAAASKKLESIIDVRGGNGHVVVRNIRFEVLEKVVEYIYKGSVEILEGEDEDDFSDAIDMLRIKLEKISSQKPSQISVLNSVQKVSVLENTMTSEDRDENGNIVENSMISEVASVQIPSNEFTLEDDLNLSTTTSSSTDTILANRDEAREKSGRISRLQSEVRFLNKARSERSYATVTGGSTSSIDSDDENGRDEMDFSNEEVDKEMINRSIAEIKSCPSGASRAPMVLKKNFATQSDKNPGHRSHMNPVNKNNIEKVRESLFDPDTTAPIRTKDCDHCDATISLKNYVRHLRSQHAEIPRPVCEAKIQLITCDYCDATMSLGYYRRHLRRKHPEIPRPVNIEHRLLGKHNNTVEHLPVNEKAPSKGTCVVKCSVCDVKISYDCYSRHVKKTHPEHTKRKETCRICFGKVLKVCFEQHKTVFHSKC